MTIRKTFAAILAALILMSLVPLALAENFPAVMLGDGAPIPYLEGFTSRLIKDTALLPGITGHTDIRFQQEDAQTMDNQGEVSIHIQNIALTDDVLALFFRAEFPDFIPLHYGTAQESYNRAAPFVMPRTEDGHPHMVNAWREGHPDGDKALQCLIVFTLESPLPDGAVLSFYGKGQLRIDKSQAKDTTRAVNPMQPVRFNFEHRPGENIDYQFKVARISFGPFGNRLVIINRDDGRGIGDLPCLLSDEAGRPLPVIPTGYRGSSLASPVNPVDMYNEVLFLGGEDMSALRLTPVQNIESSLEAPEPAVLPLTGPFPAVLTLSSGAELTIHGTQVNGNGYTIRYSKSALEYVSFTLGNAQGRPLRKLDDLTVGFDGFDLKAQAMVASKLWVAEYKGQPVSRVSEEDIKQAQTLLAQGSWRYETRPLPELAVELPVR